MSRNNGRHWETVFKWMQYQTRYANSKGTRAVQAITTCYVSFNLRQSLIAADMLVVQRSLLRLRHERPTPQLFRSVVGHKNAKEKHLPITQTLKNVIKYNLCYVIVLLFICNFHQSDSSELPWPQYGEF